jgi:hypothetical protein
MGVKGFVILIKPLAETNSGLPGALVKSRAAMRHVSLTAFPRLARAGHLCYLARCFFP